MRIFFSSGAKILGMPSRDEEQDFETAMQRAWNERALAGEDVGFLKEFRAEHLREALTIAENEDFRVWYGRDLHITIKHEFGKKLRPELRLRAKRTIDNPDAVMSATTHPLKSIDDVIAKVQSAYDALFAHAKTKVC